MLSRRRLMAAAMIPLLLIEAAPVAALVPLGSTAVCERALTARNE